MFEEINEDGKPQRVKPDAVKKRVVDNPKMNRLEEKANEILQSAYTGYLQHELPDQGPAPYKWDEAYDGIVTHLYPHDRIVLAPVREETSDVLSTPIFRQRMRVFPFTKQMVANYLKEKTGDEFVSTTEWYKNMPEQMTLIDLIRYLGNLGQELGDFAFGVLAKNGQERFSVAPQTLTLSLPPERRIMYALIVEQGIRSGDIHFSGNRKHFNGIDTDNYQRLEDRFALFKKNLRSALPGSIKTVTEVLQRHKLTSGLDEVISSLEMITKAHTQPWRELIEARKIEYQARQQAERRENMKKSRVVKAEDLDEYIQGFREQR